MKKYCKNVDITNIDFIKFCIFECFIGGTCKNKKSKLKRPDVIKLLSKYSGISVSKIKEEISNIKTRKAFIAPIIDKIATKMQQNIIDENWEWKPIYQTEKMEGNKLRKLGIEDIEMELYDYVAKYGLKELFKKKFGYYQTAAIPNKGQVFGKKAVEKWVQSSNARWAWQGDGKHYYENVIIEKLKLLLKRYVKNSKLLSLTFALLDSYTGDGLSIGSPLNQDLANFYMSFAYHYASEQLYKMRKCKRGSAKRVNLVDHVMFQMDDILFIGSSLKDLKSAVKKFIKWVYDELGIIIKDNAKFINLKDSYIDILGFKISRKKAIVRSGNFRKFRRVINAIKKTKKITKRQAQRVMSLYGWFKNSDTKHWCKRNKIKLIKKYCRKVISHNEDVIYITARKSKNCKAA